MAFKIDSKIDYSGLDKIMKNMERLTERSVSVGFGGEEHEPSGLSVGEIANFLEGGVRNSKSGVTSKPRPIVTRAAIPWVEDSEKEIRLATIAALQGKEVKLNKELDDIAEKGVLSIQENIDNQGFEPLEQSTISIKRSKGSRWPTKVALDTGFLYQNIEKSVK